MLNKIMIACCFVFAAFAPPTFANEKFPHGSCEGPGKASSLSDATGCGYASDSGFYLAPNANLYGADLSGMDLTGAKLEGVNFWSANLSKVKLTDAELTTGNFYNANLNAADLSGANLSKANLWGANLTGADLRDATLSGAFGNDKTVCPNGKLRNEADSDCGF